MSNVMYSHYNSLFSTQFLNHNLVPLKTKSDQKFSHWIQLAVLKCILSLIKRIQHKKQTLDLGAKLRDVVVSKTSHLSVSTIMEDSFSCITNGIT